MLVSSLPQTGPRSGTFTLLICVRWGKMYNDKQLWFSLPLLSKMSSLERKICLFCWAEPYRGMQTGETERRATTSKGNEQVETGREEGVAEGGAPDRSGRGLQPPEPGGDLGFLQLPQEWWRETSREEFKGPLCDLSAAAFLSPSRHLGEAWPFLSSWLAVRSWLLWEVAPCRGGSKEAPIASGG